MKAESRQLSAVSKGNNKSNSKNNKYKSNSNGKNGRQAGARHYNYNVEGNWV